MQAFLKAVHVAASARSYLSVVAIAFLCLLGAFTAILFAPLHEYAKYVLLFLIVVMSIAVWKEFSSRTAGLPPFATEDYYKILAEHGFFYGSSDKLMYMNDIKKLPSKTPPNQIPLPRAEVQEKEMGIE